jgi:hypothetical protein
VLPRYPPHKRGQHFQGLLRLRAIPQFIIDEAMIQRFSLESTLPKQLRRKRRSLLLAFFHLT